MKRLLTICGLMVSVPVWGSQHLLDLSWMIGSLPQQCVSLPLADGVDEYCTWRIHPDLQGWEPISKQYGLRGNSYLTCRFSANANTDWRGQCNAQNFKDGKSKCNKTLRSSCTKEWQSAANSKIDETQTLNDLVMLVGETPIRCVSNGDTVAVCEWEVRKYVPGYFVIRHLAPKPAGLKIFRFLCRLTQSEGEWLKDSCQVSLLD